MKMNKLSIITCGLCCMISLQVSAQESDYLRIYRSKVLDYNQDLKAAGHQTAMRQEMVKSAQADFKPKLSAGGNFNYTGNPLELTLDLPSIGTPLTFQGKDLKYGASLTLAQPIYTGGAIRANYQKARQENELARNETQRIRNNILYDADIYYWNTVAQQELIQVTLSFKNSVQELVDVIRHRVEVEYTDKNDLLMAEVKLNDADYQLLQARNNAEVTRMALNSFAGINYDEQLPIDSQTLALRQVPVLSESTESLVVRRPESRIAQKQVEIEKSIQKITDAKFLPQFHIGVDGSYSSPGYNLKTDLDPNYAVYAKLSIPLFEWGKRKSTRKATGYRIDMAKEAQSKIDDRIRLEIQTAYFNYAQAIDKVSLTESSLTKAQESEELAMERYKEGTISIVEVISAQLYHQQAQINYIQSKLNAQIAKTGFEHAIGEQDK